jgi:hypothetical protein
LLTLVDSGKRKGRGERERNRGGEKRETQRRIEERDDRYKERDPIDAVGLTGS